MRGNWRLLLSREASVFVKPVTSELSWFMDESTAEGEVGIEIIGRGG